MLEANYIACFVVSAANAGLGNLFPNEPGIERTQLLGFITGVLFLACYLVFQTSVRRNGVVLSSAFSKLGLTVSIVMSIVFFGENLLCMDKVEEQLRKCNLFISIGTSGVVYPAAGLIRYYRGNRLVLINRDETPYDSQANLVFHDSLGAVFDEL